MEWNLSKTQSVCLLAAVIIARSTSYLFSKLLLTELDSFTILAFRFLIAFALLVFLFHRKLAELNRKTFLLGVVLGLCFLAVLACEMNSLKGCSTSVTSFLENSAVVIVPLLNIALTRRLPERKTLIGSLTALLGVAMLTLGGSSDGFHPAALFAVGAAMFYSLFILLTGKFSRSVDPLLTGIVQVGTVGVGGLLFSLARGTFTVAVTPTSWVYLLALAVVCSGFGFTLQPVAQRGMDTNLAGTLCALSPLSCTILGVLFLHETLTPAAFAGCALILSAILIPCLSTLRRPKKVLPIADISPHRRVS